MSSTIQPTDAPSTWVLPNSCNVEFFNDNGSKFPTFHNTIPIDIAHRGIPRGGHTNDLLTLISGSKEEAKDYIVGLFVASIAVLCFFLAWIVLLVCLKGLGPKRVGFWSGRRQPLPPRPSSSTSSTATRPNENDKDQKLLQESASAPGPGPIRGKTLAHGDMPTINDTMVENPQEPEVLEVIDSNEQGFAKVMDDDQIWQKWDEHFQPNISLGASGTGDDNDGDNQNKNNTPLNDDTVADTIEPTTRETPPSSTHVTLEEWNEMYRKKMRYQRVMKTVVIVACIFVIVMAAMMAVKGVDSLRSSLNDGKNTINYAQGLLDNGATLLRGLASYMTKFRLDMQSLIVQANGICPRIRPIICANIFDAKTCNTTDIFPEGTFENVIDIFSKQWKFVDELERLSEELESISASADEATATMSAFDWIFYVAVGFDLLVGILALYMIVLLLFPRIPRSLQCLQHRFAFPLFLLFVLFSFIFAIAFLIVSLAASDTCADNPDARILQIAEYYLTGYQQYIPMFVNFWLSRCDARPLEFDNEQVFLSNARDTLNEFTLVLLDFSQNLAQFCGTTNPNFFPNLITTLLDFLCAGVQGIIAVRRAFQCTTWLPIYYTIVYNALCYNGVYGVWAIAATQFVTSFMACVIMTFRAVFFDLVILEGTKDEAETRSEETNEEGETGMMIAADAKETNPADIGYTYGNRDSTMEKTASDILKE